MSPTTSPSDYQLALAGSCTAMLTVALAVLTFLAGRAIARTRTELGVYAVHLAGIAVFGLYTLACDALAWWVWCDLAASPDRFLFGWPASTWFALLFAPPGAFSAMCFVVAAVVLAARIKRKLRTSPA
jgi:hypothetical protein